jgi:hypothetical protein
MSTLDIASLVIFALVFASLVFGLLFSAFFFSAIEKRYPKYYKSIGEPKALGYTMFAPTASDFLQRQKGSNYVYSLAFKGLPPDFPDDADLKKRARILRYHLFGTLGVFAVFAALFLYSASIYKAP